MEKEEVPDYLEHRKRLKNRYKECGRKSLADYEILELILTYAIPRKDVKPIAKLLIKTFGSFKKVFEQPIEDLIKVDGIGEHTAILLTLLKDSMTYYLEPDMNHKVALSSFEEVSAYLKDYLRMEIGNKSKEFFMLLCLNSSNQLIYKEILFTGTINKIEIYPREILRTAILKNATSIIIVHNHPSGNAKPSIEDVYLTERLDSLSNEVGLSVHDHIIVTKNSMYSINLERFIE